MHAHTYDITSLTHKVFNGAFYTISPNYWLPKLLGHTVIKYSAVVHVALPHLST